MHAYLEYWSYSEILHVIVLVYIQITNVIMILMIFIDTIAIILLWVSFWVLLSSTSDHSWWTQPHLYLSVLFAQCRVCQHILHPYKALIIDGIHDYNDDNQMLMHTYVQVSYSHNAVYANTYFIPVYCFVGFNLGDWLGRIAAGFYRWVRFNS